LIGSDKVEGTAVYGADDKQIGSIERVMIDKRCGPALRQYALPDTFGPSFKVSPYFRLTSACAPFFGRPLLGTEEKTRKKRRFIAVVSTFVTPSEQPHLSAKTSQLNGTTGPAVPCDGARYAWDQLDAVDRAG